MRVRLAGLLLVTLLAGSCHDEAAEEEGSGAPGTVHFTSGVYVVDETTFKANVILERVGGSAGSLTVFVYCEPDTAREGIDINGCTDHILIWADGDDAPKVVSVDVTNDPYPSGHKAIRWLLTDNTGEIADEPDEALMVIRDDDSTAPRVAFIKAFPYPTFVNPVAVATAPGDASRLYVLEQRGLIWFYDTVQNSWGVFLDCGCGTLAGPEAGTLGLVFDPGFASNGHFYVNYTTGNPLTTRVSRFTATSPTEADPGSEAILLSFDQPFDNHNGGWLGFGPDSKLYIGSGDGGSSGDPQDNGQRLDTLLGKILRINSDGTVPADNPFANDGNAGTLAEIWAYGLRNPWRGGFDRTTGDLWVGDVGQGTREEIDLIVSGGNYGWKPCEGSVCSGAPPAGHVAPVFDYTHTSLGGSASVTGGYRYRGSAVPAAAGRYFYADFINGNVWALQYNGTVQANQQVAHVAFPSSFGEDANGELYVVSYDGAIYRMVGF